MNANRQYKDSLFTDYFSDKKRLIEAYNAISGSDYPETAEIEFNTLEYVLFGALQNDISFTIGDKLVVLIEHQSTVNENMPLRMLLYISRVYERIIDNTTLYRRRRERIPKPEFIVVYNGKENCPDKETLRLSDAYKVEGSLTLELTVDVYNIAEGHNKELLDRSKALADYAAFVSIVSRYESEGAERADAIKKAIYNCVHDGIMETYLEARGSEVMNMLITEFDVEEYYKVGRMEGVEEGMEKGAELNRMENAKRMKADGMDVALIGKYTGLTAMEVEKL
jgi:hypothetical protein